MTEKTDALRLADALIAATGQADAEDDVIHVARWFVEDAAAELLRLSIENDALGLHLSERMKDLASVEAQRDALLEACRAMLTFIERHAPRGLQPEPGSPVAMARAAIKAVEEGK